MKKKILFEKTIDFPTMIGEISAISLEKDLIFKSESYIEGKLILKGKYKLTEASRIEEDFEYDFPIEISLIEKIDISTAKVDISDFYYEIQNSDTMICHIELCVDALEIIDDEDSNRECDGEENTELEIPHIEDSNADVYNIEEKKEIKDADIEINSSNINLDLDDDNIEGNDDSIFVHLDEKSETYGTFIVYIVRQNESINSIIEKYNTTIEELEKYNNLNDINIGTKLIIPLLND